MRLKELLTKVPPRAGAVLNTEWEGIEIRSVEYDSRQVGPGALFCAIRGAVSDGNDYVPQALERGAAAVASERVAPRDAGVEVPWIRVEDARSYMALLSDALFDSPSRELSLVGVTGTNGKTTTAYLIHSILSLGGPAVMAGTIETRIGDDRRPSERTTPEAPDIQRLLREAVDKGCRSGVLEVSSHALRLQRVRACRFAVGVFTNLSRDHLDFHRDMEDYFEAKSLLFRPDYNPAIRAAALNGDDRWAVRVADWSASALTFGYSKSCEIHPVDVASGVQGLRLELRWPKRELQLSSSLVGPHNVYNIMAAAAACHLLGIEDEQIVKGIESLESVPGRFERVLPDAPFDVFVDYAHTPAALENVLRLCRKVASGRVICVVGCGGDRDREKRPQMGRIAARLSDWVVLTSDNPRSEPAQKILDEMRAGIPPEKTDYEIVGDRREAIGRAIRMARRGDLVLIAGKGHETYQEIDGRRTPFDDRRVAEEVL